MAQKFSLDDILSKARQIKQQQETAHAKQTEPAPAEVNPAADADIALTDSLADNISVDETDYNIEAQTQYFESEPDEAEETPAPEITADEPTAEPQSAEQTDNLNDYFSFTPKTHYDYFSAPAEEQSEPAPAVGGVADYFTVPVEEEPIEELPAEEQSEPAPAVGGIADFFTVPVEEEPIEEIPAEEQSEPAPTVGGIADYFTVPVEQEPIEEIPAEEQSEPAPTVGGIADFFTVPVEEEPIEQAPAEEQSEPAPAVGGIADFFTVPVEEEPIEEIPAEEQSEPAPTVGGIADFFTVPVEEEPIEELPAEEQSEPAPAVGGIADFFTVPVEEEPNEELPAEQPAAEEIPAEEQPKPAQTAEEMNYDDFASLFAQPFTAADVEPKDDKYTLNYDYSSFYTQDVQEQAPAEQEAQAPEEEPVEEAAPAEVSNSIADFFTAPAQEQPAEETIEEPSMQEEPEADETASDSIADFFTAPAEEQTAEEPAEELSAQEQPAADEPDAEITETTETEPEAQADENTAESSDSYYGLSGFASYFTNSAETAEEPAPQIIEEQPAEQAETAEEQPIINMGEELAADEPQIIEEKTKQFPAVDGYYGEEKTEEINLPAGEPAPWQNGLRADIPETVGDEIPESIHPKNQERVRYTQPVAVNIHEQDPSDYNRADDKGRILKMLRNQGIGSYLRLILLAVVSALAVYLTASTAVPLPVPAFADYTASHADFAMALFVLGLAAIIISTATIGHGLIGLVTFKADGDTMISLAAIASTIYCLVYAVNFQLRPEADFAQFYCTIAIVGLLFNELGKLAAINRTKHNFSVLSQAEGLYAVKRCENETFTEGAKRLLDEEEPVVVSAFPTGFLNKFMALSKQNDPFEDVLRILSPICFVAAIIVAVASYLIYKNTVAAVTVFTAVLCVCAPFTVLFGANIPLLRAAKALTPGGTMISCYDGVEELADTSAVVINASELFPAGSIKLHGIKTFKGGRIDTSILEAASIMERISGTMENIFNQIIEGRKDMLEDVEDIVYEENMGVSAWVNSQRVLIGNRELMRHHGVDLPTREYELKFTTDGREIVYLASGGELSSMFVVSYQADEAVKARIKRLEKEGVVVLVNSTDPNITRDKVSDVFDMDYDLIRIMPAQLHDSYNEMSEPAEYDEAKTACVDGRAVSVMDMVAAAIKMRKAASAATILHIVFIILGYAAVTFVTFFMGITHVTPVILIGYQLLCTAIILLTVYSARYKA